jgi:hypothetical protein
VANKFQAAFGDFFCISQFHVLISVYDLVPDISQGAVASLFSVTVPEKKKTQK